MLREIILLIDFQSIIFPVANSIQSACSQGSINENWQAWTIIEANLFGIMSVIKYSTSLLISNLLNMPKVNENDVKYIYDILNLIIQIPSSSLELKKTSVGIIKESSRFINGDKELVKKLFAYLLQNFEVTYIRDKVFHAFSKMCIHNSVTVLENISEFLISNIIS